jgi:hypothetical protein
VEEAYVSTIITSTSTNLANEEEQIKDEIEIEKEQSMPTNDKEGNNKDRENMHNNIPFNNQVKQTSFSNEVKESKDYNQ